MQSESEELDYRRQRSSYFKMTAAAAFSACLALVLMASCKNAWLTGTSYLLVQATFLLLLTVSVILAVGGALVLLRHARERAALPDLFFREYARVPPGNWHGWRRVVRPLFGTSLRPGDLVIVKSASEVARSLDCFGRLGGLPFMPEMLELCGRVYVIDRRIDKINDWLGGNELRRVQGVVTLVDIRCKGEYHGGCQAACQILWREEWLRKAKPGDAGGPQPMAEGDPKVEELLHRRTRRGGDTEHAAPLTYVCQITELPRVSSSMGPWDIRKHLRPLFSGNISLFGYLVAVLTSAFNAAQALRGGISYPVTAPQLSQGPTPVQQLNLVPGEMVRVRSKYEIGRTLVRNKNRGMWFGRETLRHCGQAYRVLGRVTRIIDERSGEMKELQTPAITLEGVTGSGEFLTFCPQNDFVFWREIWLERVETEPVSESGK